MIRAASITVGLLAVLFMGAPRAVSEIAGPLATPPSVSQRAGIDSAVYTHYQKCWRLPEGIGLHSVTLRFELKPDGSLLGAPAIVEVKPAGAPDAAVQAAVMAVRNCAPIALPLAAHSYWRLVHIKFFAGVVGRPFGPSSWPQ